MDDETQDRSRATGAQADDTVHMLSELVGVISPDALETTVSQATADQVRLGSDGAGRDTVGARSHGSGEPGPWLRVGAG